MERNRLSDVAKSLKLKAKSGMQELKSVTVYDIRNQRKPS
jgi:hypothetical protein